MSEREKLPDAETELIAQAIRKLSQYPTELDTSRNRQFWEDVRTTSALLQQSRSVPKAALVQFQSELSTLCTAAKQASEKRDRRSRSNAARFDDEIKGAEALLNQDR